MADDGTYILTVFEPFRNDFVNDEILGATDPYAVARNVLRRGTGDGPMFIGEPGPQEIDAYRRGCFDGQDVGVLQECQGMFWNDAKDLTELLDERGPCRLFNQ